MSQKLIDLKNRMKSVENIMGTTQTMSTVAAAKLARSRSKVASLRAYTERLRRIALLQSQYALSSEEILKNISPLLVNRPKTAKIIVFVIASDIGMCGNYNGLIGKKAHMFIDNYLKDNKDVEVGVWIKGKRGERYIRTKTPYPILKIVPWSDQGVSMEDALAIVAEMTDLFLNQGIDAIYCAYTKFHGPAKREPTIIKMLPFTCGIEEGESSYDFKQWIYDPDPLAILAEIIPNYFKVQVFDILLESYASEQGARMMAMEDASERAAEKLTDMGMHYNRMRRDLITLDLLGTLNAAKVIEDEAAVAQSGF
ncbi:MAG: FoF1 ATP synthase subunit gamma [bacterium]